MPVTPLRPLPRLLCWLFFLLSASLGLAADEVRLPPAVTAALKAAGIPANAVGIVVQDVGNPRSLLEVNARQAFNPASLMKLVTTLTALETLGPAATWRTEVLTNAPIENGVLNGDLYLRGSGDPKLTYDRLWLLLRELRARGLREIRGDLVFDRSLFYLPDYDAAAFDSKPLRPYNVGPDALLFNFGTIHLTLVPQAGTVRVLADPLPAGYEVVNRLRLVDRPQCGDWREALDARLLPNQIVLSGDFPLGCGEKRWHLAGLPNTILLHGFFTRLWQELGGQFGGKWREGLPPATATTLASSESPSLGEIVRDINKYSNNVMARQLYLTLGAKVGDGPPRADALPVGGSELGSRARGAQSIGADSTATTAQAETAVRAWLATRGLDFPEFVIENGAGLSRRARIAPANLARLLQVGWASPAMPEYLASLPIPATDGTLKKKLNGNGAAGSAHLKTGSLEGVRGIAGYLLDRNGRRHIVVFMVNHPKAGDAQPAFDALLDWLARGMPAG
jgi:D-alanyl-D-alanine carboxypeptidase/D-alanyl-D-alanine-endopeptidase (penicillin-binding protein 4)